MNSLPEEFILPDYNSLCLSNVTPTVLALLGVKTDRPRIPEHAFGGVSVDSPERVILVVLDGFGYREWQNQASEGFVHAMTTKGHTIPMSTVFPSTTAAALTSLSTGLTPQEHGLPEWFVYFRELDMIVATLPFSPMGDPGRDTLWRTTDPRILFKGETIYRKLAREGIPSYSFVNRTIAESAYSTTSLRGSETNAYSSSSDLMAAVKRKVEAVGSPSLFYVYWSYVDTIEHRFGPNTDESSLEAAMISYSIQKGLVEKLDRKVAEKTLVIVTSDHGQINVSPRTTIYLNRFRRLAENFERSESGKKILPSGSPRDVFLHTGSNSNAVREYLEKKLDGVATVLDVEEAISLGLFGIRKPRRNFRDRVGDLLILPHKKHTIWYDHTKDGEISRSRRTRGGTFDMLGHHGGLTEDEVKIPFGVARLSQLQ